MSDVLGGILTKGLGADASAMILGRFRLKLLTVEVIIPPLVASGGGSHPLAPGEIQTFYKPVRLPGDRQKHVIIRVTFKTGSLTGKEYSKDFLVTTKNADATLKVLDIANRTKDGIITTLTEIRRTSAKLTVEFLKTTSKIKVFVTNFKKKNDITNK